MNLSKFLDKKVFFYCVPLKSADDAAYHHLAISIAEGLKSLGIKFYSNINYWRLASNDDHFLFNHIPDVSPDDCDVVVVSMHWFFHHQTFPHHLFKESRNYSTVYLDRQDGLRTLSWHPDFRRFDFILKTHFSQKDRYSSNIYPWAFGLTERVVNEASRSNIDFADRSRKILLNFRNKKNAHTVRKNVYRDFGSKLSRHFAVDSTIEKLGDLPNGNTDKLFWLQTGKRHYPQYYQRLSQAQACACFGGYFVSPWPKDKGAMTSLIQERIISKLNLKTRHIAQWDSWRLWESFASGCTTFHVDFDQYGLTLPVMPENWKHYVGVDLNCPEKTIEKIVRYPDLLGEVARNGRVWALEHYSSVPTAQRFLQLTCT